MPISNTLHGRDHSAFKEVGLPFYIDPDANIIRAAGGLCSIYPRSYNDGDAVPFHFNSQGHLKVDTELTLQGDVIIDNLGVYATDISDSSTAGLALIDSDGHVQTDVLSISSSPTTNTIINETSIASDPGESYSDEVTMEPYTDLSIQLYLIGGESAGPANETVTVTVEGTNGLEVGGVEQWVDFTESVLNTGEYELEATSFAATGATPVGFLLDMDNCNYEKVRLKYDWSGDPSVTDGAIVATARRKTV